jgi:DNA (cytosine-5)-methyltransferase 1
VAFHATQDPISGLNVPAIGRTSVGNGVLDTVGIRRLTPRECERLQALPDDWTLVPANAADSRRYSGLGDAVTSSVAEWIGRRLVSAAGGTTE